MKLHTPCRSAFSHSDEAMFDFRGESLKMEELFIYDRLVSIMIYQCQRPSDGDVVFGVWGCRSVGQRFKANFMDKTTVGWLAIP